MTRDVFDVVQDMKARRRAFAVATVVETVGSVSAKTGSKAVIDGDGRLVAGWVGGGCAESTTCHAAVECIRGGQPVIVEVDMDDEVLGAGMPCGGHMRVYVEPVLPRPALWIMGHGRIAECLCGMGDLLGLEVIVDDPSVERERYPAAARLITDDLDYSALEPRPGDFVVIATQHKGDHLSMQRALASGAGYVALIASRKRARLVLDHLRQEGHREEQIARVRAPAGLDLGARTPEEIALSILCEIVALHRGGSGLPMRDRLEDEAGTPRLKLAGG